MQLLKGLYGIRTVGFREESGRTHTFSFTQSMLERDIFIEHISELPIQEEDDEDEEYDPEQENINDSEEEVYGGKLSVVMRENDKLYEFLLYHDVLDIDKPVLLAQTIVFLVKVIEESKPDRLISYLRELSTDPLIPHEIIGDKKFKQSAIQLIEIKLQRARELYLADQADQN